MLLAAFSLVAAVTPPVSLQQLEPEPTTVRTKRSLLVLLRGESFRADPSGTGRLFRHHEDQACRIDGMDAQREATATHARLFSSLSSAFDLRLQLHTYEVAGCTERLQAIYQEASSVQPSIAFYDKAANNQASVWQQAWAAVAREQASRASASSAATGAPPPYDAVLALRFDAALLNPLELAAQLIALYSDARAHETPSQLMYVTFPWLPPAASAAGGHGYEEYLCRAYAHWMQRGRLPFLNDILQFYPTLSESIAERMAVTFPSHEAGDCLTSEGNAFDVRFLSNVPAHSDTTVCANEMYYLTGRNHTTVRCTLTTSEYEEACRAFGGQKLLSPYRCGALRVP